MHACIHQYSFPSSSWYIFQNWNGTIRSYECICNDTQQFEEMSNDEEPLSGSGTYCKLTWQSESAVPA